MRIKVADVSVDTLCIEAYYMKHDTFRDDYLVVCLKSGVTIEVKPTPAISIETAIRILDQAFLTRDDHD
jgi:hypothetical protein